ncbi:hypothetical protein G6O67_000983 [Ophiocordyceps sinensis]|uniref:Uncharacterized protein n=2 Tax=Ophiocordyceps sinensis TaxID=72228 RepID=A0A8H4V8E2_9HYPO|nr:hypothetical protein OCS_01844 [Ophiocordyceps sinensis CO18]KAF4511772.1 hypothetical protein G6O67_000983 [Ophiocordyceps sinensis]
MADTSLVPNLSWSHPPPPQPDQPQGAAEDHEGDDHGDNEPQHQDDHGDNVDGDNGDYGDSEPQHQDDHGEMDEAYRAGGEVLPHVAWVSAEQLGLAEEERRQVDGGWIMSWGTFEQEGDSRQTSDEETSLDNDGDNGDYGDNEPRTARKRPAIAAMAKG